MSVPASSSSGHSMRTYYVVYAAMMGLLAVMVGAARLSLGAWSLPVLMTLSGAMAVLIIVYFMHMRVTGKLMWLFFFSAFVWLATLVIGVMLDVVTR